MPMYTARNGRDDPTPSILDLESTGPSHTHTQSPLCEGRRRRNPKGHPSLTVPKSDGDLTPLDDWTAATGPGPEYRNKGMEADMPEC